MNTELIRMLREKTAAGIMDCKEALEEAAGDMDRAIGILQQRGIDIAAKKASRTASEGVVEAYVHNGNRIGVILELNCETDFVARLPQFRELAHNLALQVVAMSPTYISKDEVPAEATVDIKSQVLLEQPFIKDEACSIRDLITGVIATVGENIQVRQFARFVLGAGEAQICSSSTNEHSSS